MKLDLKLLAMRFSQKRDEPAVSEEGINRCLIERVLRPCMRDEPIYLKDIDFNAFDLEDIEDLEKYYCSFLNAANALNQFTAAVGSAPPSACRASSFC